jgi:hypothetical protein
MWRLKMCSSPSRNDVPTAESSTHSERETAAQSCEAGRKAGLEWASDESQRGYLHAWRIDPGQRMRIVINRARQAFHGRCVGQRHSFLRGFVEGAAEFWESKRVASASGAGRFARPAEPARVLLPGAVTSRPPPEVPPVHEPEIPSPDPNPPPPPISPQGPDVPPKPHPGEPISGNCERPIDTW